MKETQVKIIRDKIIEDGYVTRNWCLERYITRLGAIMCVLKEEGMKYEGDYIKTAHGRDYQYTLLKEPKQEALI